MAEPSGDVISPSITEEEADCNGIDGDAPRDTAVPAVPAEPPIRALGLATAPIAAIGSRESISTT